MCTIEIIDREFVGCNCRITERKMFFFCVLYIYMYIQVVHIRTKHVLAKRGKYASAYGAELRSSFLPSSAVQTPCCAQPKVHGQALLSERTFQNLFLWLMHTYSGAGILQQSIHTPIEHVHTRIENVGSSRKLRSTLPKYPVS